MKKAGIGHTRTDQFGVVPKEDKANSWAAGTLVPHITERQSARRKGGGPTPQLALLLPPGKAHGPFLLALSSLILNCYPFIHFFFPITVAPHFSSLPSPKKNTKSGFPGCRLLGIFTFKWIEKGLQPKAREKFKFDCRSPLVRQGLLLLIHHSDWKADTLADSNPLTNPFRSTSLSLNPHHTTGIPLPKPKPRRTTHSPTERSP